MSLLDRLFAPKSDPRDELRPLWTALVAEARRPVWYREGGVADSVAGRFDMICAVFAAVLIRLERGKLMRESVVLTELFVHDMDGQLREFGVGDMVVGKHVGKLMGALGGRLAAYRTGLAADNDALADAVQRNMSLRDGADPAVAARELRVLAGRLERTGDRDLLAGEIAP